MLFVQFHATAGQLGGKRSQQAGVANLGNVGEQQCSSLSGLNVRFDVGDIAASQRFVPGGMGIGPRLGLADFSAIAEQQAAGEPFRVNARVGVQRFGQAGIGGLAPAAQCRDGFCRLPGLER